MDSKSKKRNKNAVSDIKRKQQELLENNKNAIPCVSIRGKIQGKQYKIVTDNNSQKKGRGLFGSRTDRNEGLL